MNNLLPELLDIIAAVDESTYRAMLNVPRFARSLTPGKIVDFMIGFGHSVEITAWWVAWKRNGMYHRLKGPAIICAQGVDGPAVCVDYIAGTSVISHYYHDGIKMTRSGHGWFDYWWGDPFDTDRLEAIHLSHTARFNHPLFRRGPKKYYPPVILQTPKRPPRRDRRFRSRR